jgi:D-lactate dehydrogenase
MRIAVFDTRTYDRTALEHANEHLGHELTFLDVRLESATASLARGARAVCAFVNDRLDKPCMHALREAGVELVCLRSAGFNHVDLEAAKACGMRVTRVPEYSPEAVAEHAFALLLAHARHLPRAIARVRDANFSLEGLVGFNLHGRVLGIVGTGRIGAAVARIARGFGCRVLAYDPKPLDAVRELVEYVALERLYAESDIVSLHCPLSDTTHHLIDDAAIGRMKPTVTIMNTGRGGLLDTRALIRALKAKRIGGAVLDVYEEEQGFFFRDLSGTVLPDDVLARLLTFPNVLVTAHQGFLTEEALANIAETTLRSASAFDAGEKLVNEVVAGQG